MLALSAGLGLLFLPTALCVFHGFHEVGARTTLLAEGFSPREIKDLELLEDAYEGYFFTTDGMMMSSNLKEEKDKISKTTDEEMREKAGRAHVYGELQPLKQLSFLKRLQLPAGAKFYDLGAGVGKVAAMAYMLGLNATGLELSEGRVAAGCTAYTALRGAGSGTLDIKVADILRYDWSDADFVYTNSIMFGREIHHHMSKIARALPEGTRLASAYGFDDAEDMPPSFRTVEEISIPEIQEVDLTFIVQERIGPPHPAIPTCLHDEESCSWLAPSRVCSPPPSSIPATVEEL
eukprot:TRINITY_DN65686_c0_g1_i1.p1 TRINITY_DN65686_c0_g1~~TRINITY_DN65686_c0_g1_i1.p1  ORF type:complete len:292 (-),score=44.67 TRINITY_DN65686_c0_g1_i1:73-948(-)